MLDFLKNIIRSAGELSLDYRRRLHELNVTAKQSAGKDLVTEADGAVETFLTDAILQRYPTHAIFGEEHGRTDGEEYCWIIDPIDGTTSFVHEQPFYSVSIGVERNGQPHIAAVYAPVLDELFYAHAARGAFCNDEPIRVSTRSRIEESILATGFACLRHDWEKNNLPHFNRIAPIARGIRRYGSAAVDLCYVACGRLEGFWELNLAPYDIAAGTIILTEAGGTVTDFKGKTEGLPAQLLATNTQIHQPMIDLLAQDA